MLYKNLPLPFLHCVSSITLQVHSDSAHWWWYNTSVIWMGVSCGSMYLRVGMFEGSIICFGVHVLEEYEFEGVFI